MCANLRMGYNSKGKKITKFFWAGYGYKSLILKEFWNQVLAA